MALLPCSNYWHIYHAVIIISDQVKSQLKNVKRKTLEKKPRDENMRLEGWQYFGVKMTLCLEMSKLSNWIDLKAVTWVTLLLPKECVWFSSSKAFLNFVKKPCFQNYNDWNDWSYYHWWEIHNICVFLFCSTLKFCTS